MNLAVTYWEGWVLAHPAPALIFIACAGTLAAAAILMWAENRRDDRAAGLPQAPRRGTRFRARAVAALVRGTSWGRRAIALRIKGITVDVGGARACAPAPPSLHDGFRAALAMTKRAEDEDAERSQTPPDIPERPETPANEPARLATGAERDALVLDYAPAPPLAGMLSDDTIARGMKAVQ